MTATSGTTVRWGIRRSGLKNGDFVLLAVRVSGNEREVFTLRLRYEHPVERISVDQREPPSGNDMRRGDGQICESAAADSFG